MHAEILKIHLPKASKFHLHSLLQQASDHFSSLPRLRISAHVSVSYRVPVAQLVEHRAVTLEVVSSSPAGPTLRVFK